MISQHAIVETENIGADVTIKPFAIVKAGSTIGEAATIHPHAVIESGCVIGGHTEVFPGTYIGKSPKGAGATARNPEFDERVSTGNECAIGPNSVVYYGVTIGDNTLIADGVASAHSASSAGTSGLTTTPRSETGPRSWI